MREFNRFLVFFLFINVLAVYTPAVLAEMQQQGYSGMTNVPVGRAYESQHPSYGAKVGGKALNAFANLTTAVLEIPKNIINTTNQSNIVYGAVGGLFKGLVNTAGRIGVGITDLITIPIPTVPIAQPVYIWDNFDVDTTYGPVFRLDRRAEEEPDIVQAPSPAPVQAIPAPVAPKPEPIDNSKQYSQETNQKLDELFKKEMKK
ncbi:MAG: exosortase system-associated protein, TIGR04073 family [Methylobacter sp.]